MANRYWVGGTASWDATAGTKWATTSGGAGGASVPTTADDVFFDANSGTNTVTVLTSAASCKNLNFTGFTGTFASSVTTQIYGDVTFVAGMTVGSLATLAFYGTSNLTSAGKTLGAITVGTVSTNSLSLSDALTAGAITVATGTFTTNNYNVTASSISSSNSNTRTINLGSSTVTLSGAGAAITFTTQTNLTFNAGTSTIVLSSPSGAIAVGTGVTFYNVSWTSTAITTPSIQGANTFNNISVTGRTSAGIANLRIDANQTINGTLTLSAGTDAPMRTFVRSDVIGTARTLTCAAVASLTDIDFRDITIAGAAVSGGNLTGTRLGDCKGNSGITFDAAKTVYWGTTSSGNWGNIFWATSVGGTVSATNFPLAQDTAVFPSAYPATFTTVTVNAAYNIGTIDMSARTSNTMTLAIGTTTPNIYGNWINGTGTTLTGIGTLLFVGRGNQTITSAGKTFTQGFSFNSPGGSVTLQDAFTCSSATTTFIAGTFDANNFNVTLSSASSTVATSVTTTRTIAVGSGTWTIAGTSAWSASTSTNLTVTGTGTISLTSGSAKTFQGGSVAYTNITLNQGGAGALTISGSNTFKDITNTYSATGATTITFTSGTTTVLSQFTATGASGKVLTLGATTTSQATLQKGSSWLMGANSTDGGNNTGLSFTAGGGINYLSVSYINGTVVAPSTGNFFFFF